MNSVSIPKEPALYMVSLANEETVKPWTLVARVENKYDIEDARMDVLRPLVLKGVLTPTADGDIRVLDESKLDSLI
jgi:hypothetical protein